MGGSVSKAVKKIAKKPLNIAKFAIDPVSGITREVAKKVPGVGPGVAAVTSPLGAGLAAERFASKVRKGKKEEERIRGNIEQAQEKALARLRSRRANEEASASAAEARDVARRRQRRRQQTGRSSTILTNNLGTVGGDSGQRSLIGE